MTNALLKAYESIDEQKSPAEVFILTEQVNDKLWKVSITISRSIPTEDPDEFDFETLLNVEHLVESDEEPQVQYRDFT